jgi:hypothetical protein
MMSDVDFKGFFPLSVLGGSWLVREGEGKVAISPFTSTFTKTGRIQRTRASLHIS